MRAYTHSYSEMETEGFSPRLVQAKVQDPSEK
jgi:hypothetical protein